jgi:hypothetical protein
MGKQRSSNHKSGLSVLTRFARFIFYGICNERNLVSACVHNKRSGFDKSVFNNIISMICKFAQFSGYLCTGFCVKACFKVVRKEPNKRKKILAIHSFGMALCASENKI